MTPTRAPGPYTLLGLEQHVVYRPNVVLQLVIRGKPESRRHNAWVAVKELNLSYQNSKTMLFTLYPYYGDLN